jgi:hypothetical protein
MDEQLFPKKSRRLMRSCLIIALLALTQVIFAQAVRSNNSLSGQLIDAASGKPVYDANVFLANTTLGSTSDSSGRFLLKNIPPGNYLLVVSHISYEIKQQNVQVTLTEKSIYNFLLTPAVIELESVSIQGMRDPEWQLRLQRFEKEFLGSSDNAAACTIVNPEVMLLELDGSSLRARSAAPLEIIHERFGYHILVIVKSFQIEGDQVNYIVLPVYQALTPKDGQEAARWAENRRRAFDGSFRQFFHALFFQQLETDGFTVEQVDERRPFKTPKAKFSSDDAKGAIYSDTDFTLLKKVHFDDYLRIRYHSNYAQTSYLELPFDTLQVDLSGNSLTDAKVIRSGYWGEMRFADELPWNYWPE